MSSRAWLNVWILYYLLFKMADTIICTSFPSNKLHNGKWMTKRLSYSRMTTFFWKLVINWLLLNIQRAVFQLYLGRFLKWKTLIIYIYYLLFRFPLLKFLPPFPPFCFPPFLSVFCLFELKQKIYRLLALYNTYAIL